MVLAVMEDNGVWPFCTSLSSSIHAICRRAAASLVTLRPHTDAYSGPTMLKWNRACGPMLMTVTVPMTAPPSASNDTVCPPDIERLPGSCAPSRPGGEEGFRSLASRPMLCMAAVGLAMGEAAAPALEELSTAGPNPFNQKKLQ